MYSDFSLAPETLILIFIAFDLRSRDAGAQKYFLRNFHNFLLTLKSDSDAIKSSNSFVAVEALCDACSAGDAWLNELCERAIQLKSNKQSQFGMIQRFISIFMGVLGRMFDGFSMLIKREKQFLFSRIFRSKNREGKMIFQMKILFYNYSEAFQMFEKNSFCPFKLGKI